MASKMKTTTWPTDSSTVPIFRNLSSSVEESLLVSSLSDRKLTLLKEQWRCFLVWNKGHLTPAHMRDWFFGPHHLSGEAAIGNSSYETWRVTLLALYLRRLRQTHRVWRRIDARVPTASHFNHSPTRQASLPKLPPYPYSTTTQTKTATRVSPAAFLTILKG